MNITIIGAGAVGRLWGCKLVNKHQVHFWTRDNSQRLAIQLSEMNTTQSPIHPESQQARTFHFEANQPALLTHSQLVLITVKAFQVEGAIEAIRPYLSPETAVVVMHNGMGSQQTVLNLLPDNPIIYATTAQAAFRPNEKEVCHTGIGPTLLGSLTPHANPYQQLGQIFNDVLPPCQWQEDINQPLWRKLAINCAINPLTALHNCKNGDLARAEFDTELTAICQEVAEVMSAEGYPVTASALRQLVDTVINATASNYSSMNQDVCHQRQTEIDYISGYLIARAAAHNIDVPHNHRLWQAIKELEGKYHDQ
ncbi:2-dehydropantoate 2-reductase [Photobacterium lutimaris]|uniref:2-dehydropantoate 2-reductase n=1 Tax=Photobacterium lutimaris TaxID=388278 RepID=A0A2T3IUK8_9GAMM|nr:2-dehydropantoate 2-reductase [Photobacterium lutimaris]PSU32067.1 2-dehydropantoate 2-reductase [Photobacterium lutimaris]TDR73722.1 ketopantoate reductase [Photobacterium lutimaris]